MLRLQHAPKCENRVDWDRVNWGPLILDDGVGAVWLQPVLCDACRVSRAGAPSCWKMKPFGSSCSQSSTSFRNSFPGSVLPLPSSSHPQSTGARFRWRHTTADIMTNFSRSSSSRWSLTSTVHQPTHGHSDDRCLDSNKSSFHRWEDMLHFTQCPKKVNHNLMINFGKCGPIFKILSPGDS